MLNPVVRTVAAGLLGVGLLLGTPLARAQSAEPISFQARIDGVGDGLVQLSFDVFDTLVGGVPLNEEPIVVADASVVDGVVSVELPVSPLWFTGQSRYLGLTVDGEALADRIPIVSAPRALAARTLLDPNGNSWLHWSGNQLVWTYEPGFASFDKWSIGQANITPGDLGFAIRNLTEGPHPSGSESWLFIDQNTGFVGIGIDEPTKSLHVSGEILATLDLRCGDDVVAYDQVACGRVKATYDIIAGNDLIAGQDVTAGDLIAGSRIHATKEMTTPILAITGGADIAEPFPLSPASPVEPKPGMVMSIDAHHPGALHVSTEAYDTRVAGVYSGANGLNTGLMMGQEGDHTAAIEEGAVPLAMTGRVWVYADDSNGAIEPGDRLTTSAVNPGYAMRATDQARAVGAVIGKAMTPIDHETGMVLVLVNLQ